MSNYTLPALIHFYQKSNALTPGQYVQNYAAMQHIMWLFNLERSVLASPDRQILKQIIFALNYNMREAGIDLQGVTTGRFLNVIKHANTKRDEFVKIPRSEFELIKRDLASLELCLMSKKQAD